MPGTGTVYVDAKLSVIRRRAVGNGFHEELTILNHADEPVDLTRPARCGLRLRRPVRGQGRAREEGHVLGAGRGRQARAGLRPRDLRPLDRDLVVAAGASRQERPQLQDPHRAARQVEHAARRRHGGVSGSRRRRAVEDPARRPAANAAEPRRAGSTRHLASSATREPLKATYRRSLVDLAALRFSPLIAGGRSLPAAGLPWFMTMFGRDSILTSLQALPFTSELAATTLRALGDWQGVGVDDFRDEDPGRILHEMRYGELTAFEERPHSPYYGSADATPLFVVLLDEYERWTGDRALVRELEVEARAALNWIDEYADLQGNGLRLVRAPQQEDRAREPVLEGLLGLDLVPRRPASRASRARPASCRATRTTRSSAAPAWHGSSGRTRRSPSGSSRRPPTSSGASTGTSGSRTASTSRSRSTPTASRSTRSPRTTATSSGAASSTSRRRRPSPGTCSGRGSSPAGASAPWPRAKAATTRSATTSARSGPSTTRSSPGACGGTGSRTRPR